SRWPWPTTAAGSTSTPGASRRAAAQHRRHGTPGTCGLAGPPAFLGGLRAVVHGVADQVAERVFQPLQDGAVQFDGAALDDQLDVLAAGPGQVAHHAVEALARLGEGEQPG